MCDGEFPDRGDVRTVGAKLPVEFLTGEMAAYRLAIGELLYPLLQPINVAAAQKHADFQPFRGIGLADGLRSRQWLTFAPLEWIPGHSPTPLLVYRRGVSPLQQIFTCDRGGPSHSMQGFEGGAGWSGTEPHAEEAGYRQVYHVRRPWARLSPRRLPGDPVAGTVG